MRWTAWSSSRRTWRRSASRGPRRSSSSGWSARPTASTAAAAGWRAIDVLSLPMENALAFATDAAFPKAAGLQFALAVLPQLLQRRGLA